MASAAQVRNLLLLLLLLLLVRRVGSWQWLHWIVMLQNTEE
jgi:hypothetical protein